MAYPTSLDNFPSVIADGTSVVSEAHAVTSGSSTFTLGLNKPTGWQVIPKGAFPLPAPGGATLAGLVGGSLTLTGVYKYVVTLGTQYGETVAGTEVTITLSGSQNATTLTAIPTGGTSTNPVLYRKIYRTASGGAAGTEKLVGFLDDNTTTTFIDTLADADLPNSTPPGSNGSGLQLVTIPGFAEVVSAPASGQFSVDYSYTATGGTVTINSATTQTVNVSYTGGHLVNAALFNSLITAINSLESHAVQLSPASQQTGTINLSGIIATAGGLPTNSTSAAQLGATRWFMAQTGGDNVSSGQFDYRGIDATALSIVGAGTSGSNHKISLYDNVATAGTLTSGGAFAVLAGGAAITGLLAVTGNATVSGTLTIAGQQIGAAHAGPTTTSLTGQGLALASTGTFVTVTGETYSFTTLLPNSRVQVSVSVPVNMNTLAGDLKFVLTVTAVPAGSSLPLAGLAPQWGTVKQGVTHGMSTVTTVFNADKAGTYTLAVQYVTTNGATGSAIYNEACSFGGITTYQGTIQFTEMNG